MKKAMKLLAAVLCLVLVIGVVPVQAASELSLKKTAKVLYLGGCTGKKANGTKAKYYSYVNVVKILNGFDSKKMDMKLESDDTSVCTTSNTKQRITAQARGTANVTVTIRNKSTEKTLLKKTVKITVKKNADKDFSLTGITDGATYKVGDAVTIKMPRNKDNDLRRITISEDGAATIKKTGSYGSAYKVTFKKAGTFTIKAETYMSTKYSAATQAKSFTVTVEGAAEPTPTPTAEPTPTPTAEPTAEPTATPTATPTPTVAPADFSVKQTSLNSVTLSGVTAKDLTKKDIEIYYLISGNKIPVTGINKVEADGKNVNVTTYTKFQSGIEYFVTYTGNKGEAVTFTGVSSNAEDVASVGVTNTKVIVDQTVDLGIKFYNKDGVDISAGVPSTVKAKLSFAEKNITDAYVSGTSIRFKKADKSYEVIIEVTKGNDKGVPITFSQKVTITSYEPQFSEVLWSISQNDDNVYLKKTDKRYDSFTKEADGKQPVIEALFKYVDENGVETYKTFKEEGITKLVSANLEVLFIGEKTTAGGYKLTANNTGSTTILFYKGEECVYAAEVTILAAKSANAITVTLSKSALNVNSTLGDSLEIKAVISDQYGNELKGQTIYIEQTQDSKTLTGIASFGSFTDGKLTVKGTNIMLNPGVKDGFIDAVVKCGTNSQNISFAVADITEAETYDVVSTPDASVIPLDTGVKPGSAKPGRVTMGVQSRNGGFTIKKETLKFYASKQPTDWNTTAAELGAAVGSTAYIFTVQKDNSYLGELPAVLMTNTGNELVITTYDAGKKLPEGTYVISFFRVVVGSADSECTLLDERVLTVTDNQPKVVVTQKKVTTTYKTAVEVVKDCFEFTLNGDKLESSAIIDADINTSSTGQISVQSIKVKFKNDVYGDYIQELKKGEDFEAEIING